MHSSSLSFRRTNRGGLSRNSTKKSKLLAIARWLQRRIMWFTGHGDALFLEDDGADVSDRDKSDEDDSKSSTSSSVDSNDSSSIDSLSEGEEDDISGSDNDDDDISIVSTASNEE